MDDDIRLPPSAYVIPVAPPAATAPDNTDTFQKLILDEGQMRQLSQQGFTNGLASALAESCTDMPIRIFIIDNSGSMNTSDGNMLVPTANPNEVKSMTCTRWKELQSTIDYHIQLAALLKAPTEFRFLNFPSGVSNPKQEFSVAMPGRQDEESIRADVQEGKRLIKSSPTGVTPLSEHIYSVRNYVESMSASLKSSGKRVALILATDGLPSDNGGVSDHSSLHEFQTALKSLEGLPIWIIVRLCTDDERVIDFYSDLDKNLELSIEVLDGFFDEAKEMHEMNPWLNYALPLHRMRELGFNHRVFDFLDERRLTGSELREFCVILFGLDGMDGVPEPDIDFKTFITKMKSLLDKEPNQYHPMKRKMKPWMSLKQLADIYGNGSCTIM